MYNLIEHSDKYSVTSGSLWQFKRHEVPNNNADLTADLTSIKISKQLLQIIRNTINRLQIKLN